MESMTYERKLESISTRILPGVWPDARLALR
jgi:hypothetical protein